MHAKELSERSNFNLELFGKKLRKMDSLYNDILSLPASHLLCLAEFGSKDNMGKLVSHCTLPVIPCLQ